MEGLIEIENPNRVAQKSKKVAEVDVSAPRELSRRERWVSNKYVLVCASYLFKGTKYYYLNVSFSGKR